MKASVGVFIAAVFFAATSSCAQQQPQGTGPGTQSAAQQGQGGQSTAREDGLDPTPVEASTNPFVEMYINDYRNSRTRTVYGNLVLRDILTKLDGPDPLHPTRKGAVLTDISTVSYATLTPGATATGRVPSGDVQIFYATAGTGKITANFKSYDITDGTGFTLTPDFDFRLTSTGKEPLAFYVREQPLPSNFEPTSDLVVVNRFDNDRRIGAHWVHTCDGGPRGMLLCTIPPHTMPQPHSHPGEEAWIMVKGESILSLGKSHLRRMLPGQAYKIPPTGLAAHSNINLGDEPVEMIYMGPLSRGANGRGARGAAQAGAQAGATQPAPLDYARLDNAPIDVPAQFDVDMFMGNWRDSYPRMMHGNLYVRDMLTARQGSDPLHPTRKGAVLTDAVAVSYAMLEPRSTAHPIEGELKDTQETFVVNSGTGVIESGSDKVDLSKGKSFIITPGLDFKLTATGNDYMTFYVVTQRVPTGVTSKTTLQVIDNTAEPQGTEDWYDKDRTLVTKNDGLGEYGGIIQVDLPTMSMDRPYSDAEGTEEIWIATAGDVDMLFGKELRKLPAGTAYRVPSNGKTAHANINVSGSTAQFLYMVNDKTEMAAAH